MMRIASDGKEHSLREARELLSSQFRLTLEAAHVRMQTGLASELLARVKAASPFFERLVVELLLTMGYGGSRKDAGQAIGKSGDEGIDGVISEDRLGLDIVYLQAKKMGRNRWKTGDPAIRRHSPRQTGEEGCLHHNGFVLRRSRGVR